MSLDWNLTKIKDWEQVCWFEIDKGKEKGKKRLNPKTEILIFMTIAAGLNEITEANLDEWELRVEVLKQCRRALGTMPSKETGKLEDWWPDRQDLEAHVGLWVNTFPAKTRAQFRTMVIKAVEQDAKDELRRRREKERAA